MAGLAGVPALGAPTLTATASAAPRSVPLPVNTYAKNLDRLDASATSAQQAQRVAQLRARAAAELRASRSRRLAADASQQGAVAPVEPDVPAADVAGPAAAATPQDAPAGPAVARPANGPVTSPFGWRWGRLHPGIDIGAAYGSPIRAVAAGTVVASYDPGGYGNVIHETLADGTVLVYAHMSRIARSGGLVQAGDIIGYVGSTGHSTGPHLHLEVRLGDRPIDPRPWLQVRGIGY